METLIDLIVDDVQPENVTFFEELDEEQESYLNKNYEDQLACGIIRRATLPGGRRVYFTIDYNAKDVTLYSPVTSAIDNGFAGKDKGLEIWKLQQRLAGRDPDAIAAYRADFGTLMHYLYGKIIEGDVIPLKRNEFVDYVKDQSRKLRINQDNLARIMKEDVDEMIEDILSFTKFMADYHVEPIFSEKMVCSNEYGIASSIDFCCVMDKEEMGYFGEVYKTNSGEHKKGDQKLSKGIRRIIAVIDFKSNRSGSFYEEHKLQLGAYRLLMEENFPELEVEEYYNFSPKAWSKTSQYNLKRQTIDDEEYLDFVKIVLAQGVYQFRKSDFTLSYIGGCAAFGKGFNEQDYFKKTDLLTLIKEVYGINSENNGVQDVSDGEADEEVLEEERV